MNYKKVRLDKKAIGKKISEFIANSTYNYEEISKMLELASNRVIYYWIKGKKLPSLENLVNLSIILNAKIEDFLVIE